ncbi:MAG TPA: hypothetical protein VM925_13580 [Labilithrix sp.]|nr:hypothetical protein [Labilithrix sp.]
MSRIVSLQSFTAIVVSALALGSVACAPVEDDDGARATVASNDTNVPTSRDITAPAPEPVVITCVTNSGDHQVTEEQCKKLLTIAGCKPGAVVGDKMKCSTTSSETREENPDTLTAPAPEPTVIKCITNSGEHEVTEEQCKKLLTIAGCKPGAVVNDTMKCSTTG